MEINITKNLILLNIEANNWITNDDGSETNTAWALHFKFFNELGFTAFVTLDSLNLEYPSYAIIESDEGDLHESFCELLEDNWNIIVEKIKQYEKE